MSDVVLIWIVSRDSSLQKRMPDEVNVVFSPRSRGLAGKTPKPSLVIFDPDGLSVDQCRSEMESLRLNSPSVPVLVLSGTTEREIVFTLLGGGVKGYLLKSEADYRIRESINELLDGGIPISSPVATILMESFKPNLKGVGKYNLKDSEIELLQLLSHGMTKKEISEKYNRSIHTVDNHVRQIYSKMNVNNLGQAVGEAFRSGIIS